jgi:lysosomal-trafficking regulator
LKNNSLKERNNIYKSIQNKGLVNLLCFDENAINEATDLWRESKMSNFEYLMQLNKFSGRTFNDLMQYPIYPHILSNYISDTIDLSIKENFRLVAVTCCLLLLI